MARHLLSIMVVLLGSTMIREKMASPNQQFVFPYYHSVFYPYHQQLFGPYYQPSFGPNYPSKPANWGTVSASPASNTSKIVGGFQVSSGLIPFMAGFDVPEKDGAFQCGGTLITPRVILTAAHCFRPKKGSRPIGMKVFINSLKISEEGLPATAVVGTVQAVVIHEKYKETNNLANEYDIALMLLRQPVTTIKPVQLANCIQTSAAEGKTGFVAGWGLTKPNTASPILLGTVLNVVTNPYCQANAAPGDPPIKRTQICATYAPGGRDVCSGDSGGPLLIGNTRNGFLQIGIVSYGPEDCGVKGESPGVYTRVARFLDWINTKLGGTFYP